LPGGGPASVKERWTRTLAAVVAVLGGYLALGAISFQGALPPLGVPAFFLPIGWALAFVLRSRRRDWPILLAATMVAGTLTNLIGGFPFDVAAVWAAGDVAETVIAALMLRRFIGKTSALERVREVVWFTFVTFLAAPLATVPFALLSVPMLPEATYAEVQRAWWPAGGLGTFVIGAVALAWSGPRWRRVGWGRLFETVVFTALVTAFFLLVFDGGNAPAAVILTAFVSFPLLTVTALRYGSRGASLASLGIGVVATFLTLDGRGFLASIGEPEARLLAVQGFFALATLSALVLAAVDEARTRALRGQSLLLEVATVLAHPKPIGDRLDRVVGLLTEDFAAGAGVGLRDGGGCAPAALRATTEAKAATLARTIEVEAPSIGGDREVGGVAILPLFAGGTRVGILALQSSMGSRFDESDWDVASTLARQLETTLESERLRQETERHAKEVESNERRFRALAESTAEVLWVTDRHGRFRGRQRSWASFTGQPREEYQGYGWMEALHPDDRETLREAWLTARATGEPFHVEIRLHRHDGQWIYQEVSAGPVRDQEGRVREWVGMNVDIEERKIAEAERDRSLRKAQEAIQLRDDFLSIASHELKTPLTPLSTWLQLIQRRLDAGQPIDPSWVSKARGSLDRLATLINDLLDASRIQARRLTIRLEPVSLSDIVARQVTAAETLSERHRFVRTGTEQAVWVMGEEARLEQVLNNLIENAIKYSPRGGTIRVDLEVELGEAIVSVTDPGVGIPQDQLGRLFDRFFRARTISAASYGGLGLGLYIVRDIVDHHGGRVWVESEPGAGTTFVVTLPLLGVGPEPPVRRQTEDAEAHAEA